MAKAKSAKRHGGVRGTPYDAAVQTKAAKNIFKMNKDIGQHILKNPGIAQAIVDKADLKQSDVVLEVGPGTGNLTVKILDKAKRVIAVEMDARMAAEVTKRVQGKPEQHRLDILLGDVIKTELPYFDVCISNTPYQISSPLVFKLLATTPAPRTCILMFQREFAMRLVARPGDALYCRLSVNAQMWAKITHIMKVGRNNFNPPPAVESSVVRLESKTPRPQISYEEWDGLLRIVFVRRNKTIQAGFKGKTIMGLIERNYRTWCAQNDVLLEDGPAPDLPSDDMELDEIAADEDLDHAVEQDNDDVENGEWNGIMAEDEDELPSFFAEERERTKDTNPNKGRRRARSKVGQLVEDKVGKVLSETALADKRAGKCDEGDFLKLLWAFNQEGIHFS
ncbi:MAG: Dimethyladenosine transferase [Thelocarpon superellum]|nr:MAG: Dimethyladenosine transferase [Thelocarpon superellum]